MVVTMAIEKHNETLSQQTVNNAENAKNNVDLNNNEENTDDNISQNSLEQEENKQNNVDTTSQNGIDTAGDDDAKDIG